MYATLKKDMDKLEETYEERNEDWDSGGGNWKMT